jgi:predicted MPP superfamily phosphohydrolase
VTFVLIVAVAILSVFFFLSLLRRTSNAKQKEYHRRNLAFPLSTPLRILQISDVQIGREQDKCKDLTTEEMLWPCDAHNTTRFIKRLLEQDPPDFVVFTGDNVYGTHGDAYAQQILSVITAPVAAAGIPFAVITGNHDVELPWMSVRAMHSFLQRKKSRGGAGAVLSGNGVINFERENQTVLQVWLFEYMHSNCVLCYNGAYNSHGQYQQITTEQISFLEANRKVNTTGIAFAHVPVQAYSRAQDKLGNFSEPVHHADQSHFYSALVRGKIHVLSVGHDHVNDFCGRAENKISLCYAGSAGYTTYGAMGRARRARVFLVDTDKISTFLRLDDKSFSQENFQHLWL